MSQLFVKLTYPHSEVDVKDESIGQIRQQLVLPLHRPLFPIRAAKGKPFQVGWYNGNDALTTFGDATFDPDTKFYRNEQHYLQAGLFGNQGAFLVRLCDPKAKTASLVTECHVTKDVEIVQYQRDGFGNIKEDEDGNPLPELDGDNNPVTKSGVMVKFNERQLEEDETLSSIVPKTVTVGNKETSIYPLITFQYTSPGEIGKKSGYRMFCSYDRQSSSILDKNKCLLFDFVPVEQPYNSDTPVIVRDVYSSPGVQFAVKPGQKDKGTARNISVTEVLDRLYTSLGSNTGAKTSLLPYSLHVYDKYFKEIGDLILSYEEDTTLEDGWMVNIYGLKDLKGNPYKCAIFDPSSTTAMTSLHTHYLDGGDDGDTSDAKFEELYRSLMTMDSIPELVDFNRYPVTHIYDTGYSIDTKLSMATFISKQPNCKAVLATQDANLPLSTIDEAISTASALVARFRLTPESELYGTGALRAEIFGQAGYIAGSNYRNIVPATYWVMQKRVQYQSGQSMVNVPAGYPNNIVDIYSEVNFVPSTPAQKQLAFDGTLNYFEYKDMLTWFYPVIKSVYIENSSLLSDSVVTDVVNMLKYIMHNTWSDYVGTRAPNNVLYKLITESIERRSATAFGKFYPNVSVSAYQTEDDLQEGDVHHVEAVLVGDPEMRRLKTSIIVRRPGIGALA